MQGIWLTVWRTRPPGNRFEHLGGKLAGLCSIRVNKQYRLILGGLPSELPKRLLVFTAVRIVIPKSTYFCRFFTQYPSLF
ncbi:type II toxin-antitoxin system RelE/ParE family toxin [Marinobacter antarcticus]|uniref:type II toxin-antitoxin system RelE/ParE family toxin n=1 Tax=Marinobacter antarcticus TaxID=564117 RepID=UPI0026EE4928|nr:type II toxin-antitoxin system RelE/ParE family toxin [Marinobacter antarcticus]